MIEVYWWFRIRMESLEKENFGDFLVPYLLERTTNEDFRWVRPNVKRKLEFFKRYHYLIIGSILGIALKILKFGEQA